GSVASHNADRPMVFVRTSDDINREYLLWLTGRVLPPLRNELSGASSPTESFQPISLDVSCISCLTPRLWSIPLVVHSRRFGRTDRAGAASRSDVWFAGVPGGSSGVFGDA